MSKVVEKCVAKRLIDYFDANGVDVLNQSAFRKLHSTETALIRVHNDIAVFPPFSLLILPPFFHKLRLCTFFKIFF